MQVALLHNAQAGDSDVSRGDLLRILRAAGYEPVYFPLKQALKDSAALEVGEFVIVAGGDGSVRKVATRLAHRGRPIAVLPLGTANNIARSLGIVGSTEEIVAGWKNLPRRKIDLGLARGPWGKEWFIEGVGIGLVGRAIHIIEQIDELSGPVFTTGEDELHRDFCVLLALAHELAPTEIKIVADERKERDDFLLLEILNISRIGPGLELASKADPGDGWLDLISATAAEREKLTKTLGKCLYESRRGPMLKSRKVRRIRLSISECEVRLDDRVVLTPKDFAGLKHDRRLKIDISIEPAALEFIVPPAAGAARSGKPRGRSRPK